MNQTEKENLIKQIFASELGYLEIKKRADDLKAESSLTNDEKKVLADYEKKLQHDTDIIGIWIQKLKDAGVNSLETVPLKGIRQEILDGLKTKEQEEINEANEKIESFGALLSLKEVEQEEHDIRVAELNKRIELKNKRFLILDELKVMTKNIWLQ